MSVWSNYWRIVTPSSRKSNYQTQTAALRQDGSDNGFASVSSTTWFSNVMRGATTRLTSYKQYDSMDSGDVARALDVIAEEISNPDKRTDLPFTIDYQTEENQDVSDTTTTTLRAALRQWAKLHSLNKRVFDIAREMCKYGDCFFRKKSDTQKWEYVDPTRIIGVEIDANTGEKLAYHLKPQEFRNSQYAREESVEIVPAEGIIHFTLSNDMGGTTPFGMSLLQDAYHDWQKLRMLEDSAIIYRIVRAPERRVFYIDVGNQPAHKVKQYLEQIRNEIRQKRVPNAQNSTQADGQYNPECLALDTLIPLLDGRTVSLQTLINEHQSGKVNWAYSVNPDTGASAPGIITWAGVTRKNAERIKLTLDNGKEIIVTPDHKFPIQGKGFIEAKDILANDSLFPFTKRNVKMYGKSDYEQIWDSKSKSWQWTHRIVAEFMKSNEVHNVFSYKTPVDLNSAVVHHLDYGRFNNTPSNLTFMDKDDHIAFHAETKKQWWDSLSDDRRAEVCASIAAGTQAAFANMDPKIRQQQIDKATDRIRAYHLANKINPSDSYINWLNNTSTRIAALSNLEYIRELRRVNGKKNQNVLSNQALRVSQDAISRMIEIIKHNDSDRISTMKLLEEDEIFMSIFRADNVRRGGVVYKIEGTKVTDKYLKRAYKTVNAINWKSFKEIAKEYNHKVVKIEAVDPADVGTITIDGRESFHNFHTFALDAGVYTKNSIQEDYYFPVTAAGRGSRVETIAGGGTWETPELDHFLAKVFRALRVPSSYMRGADSAGAQYSDGKVGIAYIEELRFANFIMRLQSNLEDVFDAEFKTYLAVVGINIDPDLFKLSLPEPQNFALYRQSQLDTDLINSFKSIGDTAFLSKRFMLNRYLGLTLEEIQMNEAMLKEEKGIIDDIEVPALRQIYDENAPKVNTASEPEVPVDDGNAFGLGAPEEPVAGEQPPLEDDAPSTDILDEPAPQ